MPSTHALGFRSYEAYLKSSHWRDVKRRYRESDRPQDCVLCGTDEHLQLHHLTYVRLGRELLEDLAPLCARCHTTVHVLVRRGDATLTLRGIVDGERASAYREQMAGLLKRAMDENTAQRRVSVLDKGELTMLNDVTRRREHSLNVQAIRRRREIGNQAFRAEGKRRKQEARAQQRDAERQAAEDYARSGRRSFSPDE